jgi:hypothetical protein
MQEPAQRRGLHETLVSPETSSDVPVILFHCGPDFPVWQGAKPRTPSMKEICHFTTQFSDLWLRHVAEGLSGIAFQDGLSSVYSAEIPSWSGRDPVIRRPRGFHVI